MSRRQNSLHRRVRRAFDRAALKRVCEMYELDFSEHYPDLSVEIVESRKTNNFYYFADRGSDILFVAHLDTVVPHERRGTSFVETKGGPVVHSGALDDRLGAYIGLELLPRLGLHHDILLTVGEESGQSTAEFFETEKDYNWIIEFDRGGTDVVMYRYQDMATADLVRASGAKVGHGSFSDICELEHIGVKAFNWGTGYRDYHSVRGYAFLEDTYQMVIAYLKFHAANHDTRLPHEKRSWSYSHGGGGGYSLYGGAGVGGSGSKSPKGSGASSEKKRWWEKEEPDGEIEGGGVRINGREYASYEDWWNDSHPDDPMIADEDSLWARG